jgi:hypothetical protein
MRRALFRGGWVCALTPLSRARLHLSLAAHLTQVHPANIHTLSRISRTTPAFYWRRGRKERRRRRLFLFLCLIFHAALTLLITASIFCETHRRPCALPQVDVHRVSALCFYGSILRGGDLKMMRARFMAFVIKPLASWWVEIL